MCELLGLLADQDGLRTHIFGFAGSAGVVLTRLLETIVPALTKKFCCRSALTQTQAKVHNDQPVLSGPVSLCSRDLGPRLQGLRSPRSSHVHALCFPKRSSSERHQLPSSCWTLWGSSEETRQGMTPWGGFSGVDACWEDGEAEQSRNPRIEGVK